MGCLICERIQRIKNNNNPYFVCELETGYVVLGDHQRFKGYTLFLCKEHTTELHLLNKEFLTKYLAEMTLVAEAVFNVYKPDKMNYELLGNGDSHIHWHLFPRYNGDLGTYGNNGKGPVWWLPKEEMWKDEYKPNPEELAFRTAELKKEIERLITGKFETMHYMRLEEDSFQAIKEGRKTIEMRLNDEKRSLIKEGDSILFSNVKTKEEIECKVIKIYKYPDFEELYQHHSKLSIGYKENENADPKDMLNYYSTDKINKYGVLGIEIILMS